MEYVFESVKMRMCIIFLILFWRVKMTYFKVKNLDNITLLNEPEKIEEI